MNSPSGSPAWSKAAVPTPYWKSPRRGWRKSVRPACRSRPSRSRIIGPAPVAPKAEASQPAPTAAASQPDAAPPAAEVPAGGVYEVVKGDNPYSIAKRFGVSYDALMKENSIDDPTKLQIGQKLKIPAAAN